MGFGKILVLATLKMAAAAGPQARERRSCRCLPVIRQPLPGSGATDSTTHILAPGMVEENCAESISRYRGWVEAAE